MHLKCMYNNIIFDNYKKIRIRKILKVSLYICTVLQNKCLGVVTHTDPKDPAGCIVDGGLLDLVEQVHCYIYQTLTLYSKTIYTIRVYFLI